MKVLLDPQIFLTQKFGGISRLFGELWYHFNSSKEVSVRCPLTYNENLHLEELNLGKGAFQFLRNIEFKGKYRVKNSLDIYSKSRSKSLLKSQRVNIFLSTYYDPYFLEHTNDIPFVLTVYDMIHELLPQYFPFDKSTVPNKRELIYKSKRIVAISNQTKNDIVKLYPDIDHDKIDVVYLAQSIKNSDELMNIGLPEKYLLFVGNRDGYKNFEFLLRAIATFLRDNQFFLVCAGGSSFSLKELELINLLGIENHIIQRKFLDNELSTFYQKAKAFIFPSEYEGFGIPILEAMKCKCPVILANSGCFKEVAKDAALFFKLGDENSLKQQVENIVFNGSLCEDLIKRGINREKEFSWEKTAQDYLTVIKKALDE